MEPFGTLRRGVQGIEVHQGVIASWGETGERALEVTASSGPETGYLRPFLITSRREALALAAGLLEQIFFLPDDA